MLFRSRVRGRGGLVRLVRGGLGGAGGRGPGVVRLLRAPGHLAWGRGGVAAGPGVGFTGGSHDGESRMSRQQVGRGRARGALPRPLRKNGKGRSKRLEQPLKSPSPPWEREGCSRPCRVWCPVLTQSETQGPPPSPAFVRPMSTQVKSPGLGATEGARGSVRALVDRTSPAVPVRARSVCCRRRQGPGGRRLVDARPSLLTSRRQKP